MDQSTALLSRWLEPIAEATGLPLPLLSLVAFALVGVIGHVVLGLILARLNRAVEKSANPWDNVIAVALAKPSEWLMWLVLVYLSLGLLEGADQIRAGLRQLADTGLVLLLGWFVQRILAGVEAELLGEHRGPRDSDARATISATLRLLRITLWIVVSLMILQSVGVSVSGLLAFGGIGGIAVGFAARDLLANFLGGLSIYLDRPFTVGDWIRSPDREIEGTVESIGWRMTMIRTFDQRPLYVPNAVFSSVALENPSRMRNRRIYETIGIRYQDIRCMSGIVADVKAMLEGHEAIDLNRTLMVNFVNCGPSSLDFFVYTFTKTTDWATYHGIKQDVLLRILEIIEAHGAEVAFPTSTIHLAEDESSVGAMPRPEPTA